MYFTGKLFTAANFKEDEDILREIREQDCVSRKIQYHKSCYRQYIYCIQKHEKPSDKAGPR